MSYKVKSALYFASFVLAIITYHTVGQADASELALKKEINKIENQTVVNQNATALNNLQ